MKTLKGFLCGIILAIIPATTYALSYCIQDEIYPNSVTIFSNGEKVTTPNFIWNDTTYAPLRDIAEKADCNVSWNDTDKSVFVLNNYCCNTLYGNNIVNGTPVTVKELYKYTSHNPLTATRYKHLDLIKCLGDVKFDSNTNSFTIDPYLAVSTSNNTNSTSQAANSAPTLSSANFPWYLYSNDGVTYLGKLTTNTYDSDSIWNTYGKYGSQYQANSIWNTYGKYGSQYSATSAFNEYAVTPPKIVDSKGYFVGYLTTNTYKQYGITIEQLKQFLIENYQ